MLVDDEVVPLDPAGHAGGQVGRHHHRLGDHRLARGPGESILEVGVLLLEADAGLALALEGGVLLLELERELLVLVLERRDLLLLGVVAARERQQRARGDEGEGGKAGKTIGHRRNPFRKGEPRRPRRSSTGTPSRDGS
jgi:hypothetical protein